MIPPVPCSRYFKEGLKELRPTTLTGHWYWVTMVVLAVIGTCAILEVGSFNEVMMAAPIIGYSCVGTVAITISIWGLYKAYCIYHKISTMQKKHHEKISIDVSETLRANLAQTFLENTVPTTQSECTATQDIEFHINDSSVQLYTIFDGDQEPVGYLEENLLANLEKNLENLDGQYQEEKIYLMLMETFMQLRNAYEKSTNDQNAQANVTCALQIDGKIYIANVGNCRAILVKNDNEILQLTADSEETFNSYDFSLKITCIYEGNEEDNFDRETVKFYYETNQENFLILGNSTNFANGNREAYATVRHEEQDAENYVFVEL